MAEEDNIAVVRRMVDEAWNRGNVDVIDELCAPDCVHHAGAAGSPQAQISGAGTPEDTKAGIRSLRSAFPDLHISLEDVFAQGDSVACRYITTGTNRGSFMGRPPTNKRTFTTGMSYVQLNDGKIASSWSEVDVIGLLQDIGVLPSPEQLRERDRQRAQEAGNA